MSEAITIVGGGEIGRRFAQGAQSLGLECEVLGRGDTAKLAGPAGRLLVVCVREDDLAGVLASVPASRNGDLVIVQNGFVDEALADRTGYTRAVLWFTSKGSFFADVLQSPVHGPNDTRVRDLIHAAGATAETIHDPSVFKRYALEKAIWSCVVGAPLAVWGTDLSTARVERAGEIHDIVTEACALMPLVHGVEVNAGRVLATLESTTTQLGWLRGGTRSVAWRNGKVCEWGARTGIATPANRAIVDAVNASAGRTTEVE